MSALREIPAIVRKAQISASDPEKSVWVSANAGSGKTHVLAQRVLRHLLAGVAPAKILCLTFTKAAAANMAVKVFATLSKWTRQVGRRFIAKLIEHRAQKLEMLFGEFGQSDVFFLERERLFFAAIFVKEFDIKRFRDMRAGQKVEGTALCHCCF